MRTNSPALFAILLVAGAHPACRADADEAPAAQTIDNSLGMKLVFIPPGEFAMGAPQSDSDARADERPLHSVRITRPFYLGASEVTVGQFRAFVEATEHVTGAEQEPSSGYNHQTRTFEYDQHGYNWRRIGWKQDDSHPVLNVSWFDADAFCRWLSRKEGRRYRLPTEAEWEYACRAGGQGRFVSGDAVEDLQKIANVQDQSLAAQKPRFANSQTSSYLTRPVPWDDGSAFTAPVGSFQPNPFGLYDMLGNAAEWCADWYGEDYYRASPGSDPAGPESGQGRVARGGAFLHQPAHCRASDRASGSPSYHNYVIGFRVAAAIEAEEAAK